MRKLSALAFAATAMSASAAMAQEPVVVDLTGVTAAIAADLAIDAGAVPRTVSVSSAIAADVCGIEEHLLSATCAAITVSADLLLALRLTTDDGKSNSAREFAPGQQDGPAREFAPGQQDGNARDSAPGQLKKN